VKDLEKRGMTPASIRARLAALSSLFAYPVAHQVAEYNPARDVKRPRLNRRLGTTPSFGVKETRLLLDAPNSDSL